jgi:hypothetical protein
VLYYVYFSNGGIPQGGLSPVWYSLQEASGNGGSISVDNSNIQIREVGWETADPSASTGNGWYYFDVTYGQDPWTNKDVDLVGVIDGGATLSNVDRYKPICVSLRGEGLARIAHKGIQQANGDVDIYKTDQNEKEMTLDFVKVGDQITRTPTSAS